jgi:hypothetical protein
MKEEEKWRVDRAKERRGRKKEAEQAEEED